MLDIKYLRNHLDDVANALKIKGFVLDKDTFIALDAERKKSDIEYYKKYGFLIIKSVLDLETLNCLLYTSPSPRDS
mgnify:CR=1 FL=1